MHPSSGKVYSLLKTAYPKNIHHGTRKLLERITQSCEICSEHLITQFRFRASIPEEYIMFNREIEMDLMWLNGK